jgi:hypothetical protein
MSDIDLGRAFGGADALSVLLALVLAALVLYLGNEGFGVLRAIAQEDAGIKEAIDECKFVDFARKPEFMLLLATAAAAALGVGWWVAVPLCLAGLSIGRLPRYLTMWPRAIEIGEEWQVIAAVTLSSVASLAGALGMFAIGAGAGWLMR